MKKLSLFILSLFIIFVNLESVFGQSKTTIKNSFVIHGTNLNKTDLDFYTKSIEAADFEQFRLQTQTVFVTFKNGFNLELIPAKDLVVKNIKADLDINFYTNYPATPNYKYPLFEVLPSGWITAAVESTNIK
jgi:hypothetical protein